MLLRLNQAYCHLNGEMIEKKKKDEIWQSLFQWSLPFQYVLFFIQKIWSQYVV